MSAVVTCVSRVVSRCLGEVKGRLLEVGRVFLGAQQSALAPRPQWARAFRVDLESREAVPCAPPQGG